MGFDAVAEALRDALDELLELGVLEGVETPAQLAQVRAENCTEIQGYYYSKPVPAGQVPGLIQRIANQHSRPALVRAYALAYGSIT